MKFRRNLNDQKVFLISSIICFIVFLILLVLTIAVSKELLSSSFLFFLTSLILFLCSYSTTKDFIEFNDKEIRILNLGKITNVLKCSEITKIYMPNKKSFPILIEIKNIEKYPISYSEEIKKYILENYNNIEYYTKYNNVLK